MIGKSLAPLRSNYPIPLNLFGYAGSGAITAADYNAGTLLASVSPLPGRGHTIRADVTDFVDGLLTVNAGFAGFALRAGSIGALGVTDARLAATPGPGSLALLAVGSIGVLARVRRTRRTRSG